VGFRYALSGAFAAVHALAILVAAYGYGRVLLARVRLPRGLRPLAAVVLGSGVLGHAALALGLVGAFRPAPLALVLGGGLLLGLPRRPPPLRPSSVARQARQLLSTPLARWSAAALALALPMALLGALLPEIEYDALWYHLTFPARYLAAGRLLDLPCEHMSALPQQVELLYAYGLLRGDPRAVKLLHYGFGVLAGVAAGWLAARHLGRRWALPAAALALVVPTLLWEMTTAYNELPLALEATVAVALLLEWRRERGRGLLVAAAAILGVGLAGKHLAWFFVAPLGLYVLLAPGRNGEARPLAARAAEALAFGLVVVLVPLPWYVRAWWLTGNPLFPMFYGALAQLGLPLQRWDALAEAGWKAAMGRYGMGRDLRALLLLPWRMTWNGVRFAGSLGPAWLLFLPPLALGWRRLPGALRLVAALAAVFLLLWASPFLSFQVRYLVPLVPLLAVLAAAALAMLRGLYAEAGMPVAWRLTSAATVAALAVNLPALWPLNDARVTWIPNTIHAVGLEAWRAATTERSAARYLRRRLESYDAAYFVDHKLSANARVVWFGESAQFYMRQDVLLDYSACVTHAVWGRRPGDELGAFEELRRAGVTHIAWDHTLGLPADSFAVRSPVFRTRYARPIYRDHAIEIDELVSISASRATPAYEPTPP
jgi:4-amino-4-deoxy-L-arabinose transferase-like glycosyltransferase